MGNRNPKTIHLLQKWLDGDEESLAALVELELPRIRRHVHQRIGPVLRSKGETGDYVQDALIEFLRFGPRFVLQDEHRFRALLCRIVENTLRSRHGWFTARRRAIARERPLPPTTIVSLERGCASSKTPSRSAERHEREALVRLGMELLDPDDRDVIVMREWEDLSFNDIGKQLDIPANTARMRHTRAVRRLAKKVDGLRRRDVDAVLH